MPCKEQTDKPQEARQEFDVEKSRTIILSTESLQPVAGIEKAQKRRNRTPLFLRPLLRIPCTPALRTRGSEKPKLILLSSLKFTKIYLLNSTPTTDCTIPQ